jgi:transaldolase
MSLSSLIDTGTKLWLDSVDPDEVQANRKKGATGATSNPIIISDILKTGRYDDELSSLIRQGLADDEIAWEMTDRLVKQAQSVFLPAFEQTRGNDGYVSFELDPLLEDVNNPVPIAEATKRYIELAKKWSANQRNRMIKIPATEAGLAALEEVAAAGVTINVTLLFTDRQYTLARDAIWRGRQRFGSFENFKSVYSIFVSRVDVYAEQHCPTLSNEAKGMVGILNAKELYIKNNKFWADKRLPLEQEMIFASTGTKKPTDSPDKYVEALAGDDIQTNPPKTNEAVEKLNKNYTRQVEKLPPAPLVDEIHRNVDQAHLEKILMAEGTKKFAEPQHKLLELIAGKRKGTGA